MKAGARALGVAESFRRDRETSTLAGVVVRASRVVDGIEFATATVGGTDATGAVLDIVARHDREDLQYLLVGGLALSWYNVVDLRELSAAVDPPVISVTFGESEGLEEPLEAAFEGEALQRRLRTYRAQPERHRTTVNDEVAYVRSVDLAPARARDVVRAFTPEGGRPEPIRVARLAARGCDAVRTGERGPKA